MKIINLRHTTLAWLLLAAIVCLVWLSVISPLLVNWNQHQARSQTLAVEIADIKTVSADTQQSLLRLKSEVAALISAGSIAAVSQPAEAAQRLEKLVKHALAGAGASVSQMRPETTADSPWLAQSQLTIEFRINSGKLDALLHLMAEDSPGLQLESLNLRLLENSSPGNPAELEASAKTHLWFMSVALEKLIGLNDEAALDDTEPAPPLDKPARLAGLFDATYRSRLQNPGTDDYRLTAIALSADARIAVITDLATGVSKRLREGDMLDGWKIVVINPDNVKLAADDQLGQLDLQKN